MPLSSSSTQRLTRADLVAHHLITRRKPRRLFEPQSLISSISCNAPPTNDARVTFV
jgi:hypothetical protein